MNLTRPSFLLFSFLRSPLRPRRRRSSALHQHGILVAFICPRCRGLVCWVTGRAIIKLLHELGLDTRSLLVPPRAIRFPLFLQLFDLLVRYLGLHHFVGGLEDGVAPIRRETVCLISRVSGLLPFI